MTWVKLDDGFTDHPKVIDLSDRAFRLHITALCYCGRSSPGVGMIPAGALKRIGATPPLIAELVGAALWERGADDVLYVHDFSVYNPPIDRIAKADAGRLGGLMSGASRRKQNEAACFENNEAETKQPASTKPEAETKLARGPAPDRPDPTRSLASSEASESGAKRAARSRKTEIREIAPDELAQMIIEFPDFDVGAELENCRNIQTWKYGYVAECTALRARLRMKRADPKATGGTYGNPKTRGNHRNPPQGPDMDAWAKWAAQAD